MQLSELMHRKVHVIDPDASVRDAARKMSTANIGALPVCSGNRIVGIITDRDIIVRSLARGGAPDSDRVADAMTQGVDWCFEDAALDDALGKMRARQIQRLIVVNHNKRLVGMLSLADLAQPRAPEEATQVVEEIKAPTKPSAVGTSAEQEAPTSQQRA